MNLIHSAYSSGGGLCSLTLRIPLALAGLALAGIAEQLRCTWIVLFQKGFVQALTF